MVIKSIKGILIYTVIVLFVSVAYFIYAYNVYPPVAERETFLSEIGEDFGEAGLWLLLTTQLSVLIYGHLRVYVLGGNYLLAHLVGLSFTFGLPLLLARYPTNQPSK